MVTEKVLLFYPWELFTIVKDVLYILIRENFNRIFKTIVLQTDEI